MKKYYFVLILFCYTQKQYSQSFKSSFGIKLTKKSISFSYVDKEKDEAYLFVGNNKKVRAINYDSNFNSLDSLTITRPEIEFENIAGCNKKNETLNLFWSTSDNSKIYQQKINFQTKESSLYKKHVFDFSNQKLLQTFSSNNLFYLLSITKNSSQLIINSIDFDGKLATNKIDLSKEIFLNSKNESNNLFEIFKENINSFDSSFETPLIDNSLPNSLSITSKKRKLFFKENKISITIDSNQKYTHLITLNLSDFSFSSKKINQKESITNISIKTNSLLVDDKMYQLILSNEEIALSISDLDGKLLKSYVSKENENIHFKNTKVFEEYVNSRNSKVKIENTSQFAKKNSNLNLGLCFYKFKNNNLITIGGVSKHINKIQVEEENNPQFYLMQYGLIGALIYVAYYNQNQANYDFSRDFAYFYTYLDSNNEVIKEEVNYYNLDLIRNFFKRNPSAIYPTLISLKSGIFLGYYKPERKQYSFMQYDK